MREGIISDGIDRKITTASSGGKIKIIAPLYFKSLMPKAVFGFDTGGRKIEVKPSVGKFENPEAFTNKIDFPKLPQNFFELVDGANSIEFDVNIGSGSKKEGITDIPPDDNGFDPMVF